MVKFMENGIIEYHKKNELIETTVDSVRSLVTKDYLNGISSNRVIPMPAESKSTDCIRILKLDKFIFSDSEDIADKLINVYSALHSINSSVMFIIRNNHGNYEFYIGVRCNEITTAYDVLLNGISGNFPGSKLSRVRQNELNSILENVVTSESYNNSKSVTSVTVIPSIRESNSEGFVQGIEKFFDSLQGDDFSAIFVADPVESGELQIQKRGYEDLYTTLSPYEKNTIMYGENYSSTITEGEFKSFSNSVNSSISDTLGHNKSVSSSRGSSSSFTAFGWTSGDNRSTSNTSGTSSSRTNTSGTAKTDSNGTNSSKADTTGNNKSVTVDVIDKSVKVVLEKIESQLERIRKCESFGVWKCAAYFISEKKQTSIKAGSSFRALMLGDSTDVENSYLNIWSGEEKPENTVNLLEYMRFCQHPVIELNFTNELINQQVSPHAIISGKELPLILGLPYKSIAGLTVTSTADFGRNIFVQNSGVDEKTIEIGNIYHKGNIEAGSVELNLNSLTSHCFITGSTGSGKSNTTYVLIEKLIDNNIPFMVIEPAKGEYKDAFGGVPGINIFTTNPLVGQMLKINPFEFNEGIHVLEHLDRLIEIFNACWEMYAAMPAILKDAIEQMYIAKGWDLLNSVYVKDGDPVYPTFADLLITLPEVINNSGYSAETKGNYVGALVTRVKSLTNGISGQIFCDNYAVPDSVLFDENTIVDLSRVGSTETKSLIMGLLVLKLSEYRMSSNVGANSDLRHVCVLEEAHNLLKRVPVSAENNLLSKSVEMICNSIAEMRTYGEGFIIVDQSPTAVDIAAIKNTNTKIVMRLPEHEDCMSIGSAVGLNESQIDELSKLPRGVAVIMQNNWIEAVLSMISCSSNRYYEKIGTCSFDGIRVLRTRLVNELIKQFVDEKQMDKEKLIEIIDSCDLSKFKKSEMKMYISTVADMLSSDCDRNLNFSFVLLSLTGMNDVFEVFGKLLVKTTNKDEPVRYTEESFKRWKAKIFESMNNYLEISALSNGRKNTLFKALILAKSKKSSWINYNLIKRDYMRGK